MVPFSQIPQLFMWFILEYGEIQNTSHKVMSDFYRRKLLKEKSFQESEMSTAIQRSAGMACLLYWFCFLLSNRISCWLYKNAEKPANILLLLQKHPINLFRITWSRNAAGINLRWNCYKLGRFKQKNTKPKYLICGELTGSTCLYLKKALSLIWLNKSLYGVLFKHITDNRRQETKEMGWWKAA